MCVLGRRLLMHAWGFSRVAGGLCQPTRERVDLFPLRVNFRPGQQRSLIRQRASSPQPPPAME
ncbi:hypothetical protein DB30_06422 [Enhygromyxa salina]|uniref:Uncharacterized protein n=1 Tax=Enhygromyxa salina TaxID=215803 RepID=A0A0C2CU88_9BACT|nr:hypothetical protein DB30_06422 [Enhygromyxa salina]